MADKKAQIKKQLEFYFSDSSYRKDTFLRAAADADPEGFVPVSILTTFNKLKALSTDPAEIAEAVEGSTVVTLSEDKLRVKKSTPLPEEDSSRSRTLYVKGFPLADAEVTIEAITEQFSRYGTVLFVRLRRDPDSKAFKGSCFIEFETQQSVTDTVAAAYEGDAVKLKYKDTPFLCLLPLNTWLERKAAKRQRRKAAAKEGAASGGAKDGDASASTGVGEKRKREEEKIEFTPGLLIALSNVPEDSTIYQIKDFFAALGEVKYVDYKSGNKEATVRAADSASATKILAELAKGISLKGDATNTKLESRVITGEEETQYWTMISADSKKKAQGKGGKGGRGQGRGGGRGGRGGRGRGFKGKR